MKNLLRFGLTFPLTLALLNGCGGGSLDTEGSIRLVNATSEYATLDLYAGADRISAGVASNSAGAYANIEADTYTFNLKSGGSTATAVSTRREVDEKDHHTLVAYTSGGTLTTEYLSDEERAPSSGTAKLRVFHTAATDAGNVDLFLVNTPCAELQSSTASAIASNVSGLQSGFTEVSAASGGSSYHACITAAGDKSALRLDIPALSLSNQQVATLILTRTAGGVLLNGMLLTQQGTLTPALNTSARVRLAASASAAGVVTARLGSVLLGSQTSPAVGGYTLVPAGSSAVEINGVTVPLSNQDASATAGGDFTLLVTGSTAAPAARLIADDNTVSTSTVRATKIRLVNGLNGVGGTVTLSVDDEAVGNGAAFGQASSPEQVQSSAGLARLEANYSATRLYLREDVTLTAGRVYTLFLLGDVPVAPALVSGILRVDR
ncbi:MAG: DUF4397 domain-containing protein [Burkholderiales bacterium]|nr:DUF4397 domain-containing protein [Burkholderiales bacterium]